MPQPRKAGQNSHHPGCPGIGADAVKRRVAAFAGLGTSRASGWAPCRSRRRRHGACAKRPTTGTDRQPRAISIHLRQEGMKTGMPGSRDRGRAIVDRSPRRTRSKPCVDDSPPAPGAEFLVAGAAPGSVSCGREAVPRGGVAVLPERAPRRWSRKQTLLCAGASAGPRGLDARASPRSAPYRPQVF